MCEMKKYAVIFIFIFLLVAGAWLGYFYWQNLRGLGPALKPPPEDIAKLLPPEKSAQVPPAINETEFPLKLPAGFKISIFAKGLESPRVMTYDPAGNIVVSIPAQGKVVALPDKNSDGVADEVVTVIDGLNRPHGLATRCTEKCEFFIAESNQVAYYNYNTKNLKTFNKRKIIDLPSGGNHITRTILFMPSPNDHKLLTSVGSTCNVCEENDWLRAKILISNADGGDLKTFASGLRNSVFMTIHPVTGKIWATEMGRDLLGDNLPPDEINIVEEGKDYGWPYFYGKDIRDAAFEPDVMFEQNPDRFGSHIDIPAHSAPLGLAFIPEEGWPQEYWHNLLVAYHGSWNRTVPTGYKIVRYKLDAQGNYLGEEDFISGWLTNEGALGRPVDILVQPGGIIYVSDDKAGVIYKITR